MNCRFCEIISRDKDKILRESKYTVTIFSDPKLMEGHLLIIPKRHIEKMNELDAEERKDLFDEVIDVQDKIISKFSKGCDISEHYRPFIPENKLKVDHIHIHIRPRELDDELFMKVQINESRVFTEANYGSAEKFRELLNN